MITLLYQWINDIEAVIKKREQHTFCIRCKRKKMAYWLSHMPCRATFEKSFRRNEHVERCKRIFNCGEVCGKSFKSKQALTVHFNGTHGKLNVWDCLDYRCFRETQGRQLATRRCMLQTGSNVIVQRTL